MHKKAHLLGSSQIILRTRYEHYPDQQEALMRIVYYKIVKILIANRGSGKEPASNKSPNRYGASTKNIIL